MGSGQGPHRVCGPTAPQFHAIARQHVIDGDALFETLEVGLWRWHESYNGKRYWPLSWTIQPCRQASANGQLSGAFGTFRRGP